MGRGSYTASDWTRLRKDRGLSQCRPVERIFASKKASACYDCRNITLRESRDSQDSPKSTPVIIGFDVTGSMGYLAKELAVNTVNKTVLTILNQKTISDPHVLCSAIGDSRSDTFPLQATQFEADIRILEQLLGLYLEGGGGGNDGESYNLLWYFAAYHTDHDHYRKRGEKGFLFTIGDDRCHSDLSAGEIRRVFGDTVPYAMSNEELLQAVREKYHVFHIHIEKNDGADGEIFAHWRRLLPGCCTRIGIRDVDCLSGLIPAILSVASGKPVNSVLRDMDQSLAERIAAPMALIEPDKNKKKTIQF